MPTGAEQGAQADAAMVKQDVCRVSVKLPPFWPEEPTLWFAQVEGQFTIAGITADTTKFYTVVGQLDHRYMVEARDIIENPPAQDKYAKLKAELIRRLSDSREKRVQQILTQEELGDRKPSQFLRHLQTLAGPHVPDTFLATLWASRLPTNIQTVIASQPNLPLQSVADLADRVHEIAPTRPALTTPPAVASTSTSSDIAELKQCMAELCLQVAALQKQGEQRKTPIIEEKNTTEEPITSNESKPVKSRKATKGKSDDLKTILLYSNASLIRNKDSNGYCCNFCPKKFEDPKNLKTHSLEEHSDVQTLRMPKSFEYLIKLDITNLKCKICNKILSKLDDFAAHLKTDHSKKITTDLREIIPFKFDTKEIICAICDTEYSTFKILQEHMHNHFRNHICEICNAGFITRRLLICHKRRHAKGEFKCSQCDKTFICDQKRRDHEQRMHLGLKKRNKCKVCDEKFDDYWTKMHHMVQKHGAPPISLKCTACDRIFTNRRSLARHVKKDHLMERQHACNICDMQFFWKHLLVEHMRVHTGIKKFQCHVCSKHYATKKSLRQHLRSHADDRRFACTVCGLSFVQKRTLNSHIKAKHGE